MSSSRRRIWSLLVLSQLGCGGGSTPTAIDASVDATSWDGDLNAPDSAPSVSSDGPGLVDVSPEVSSLNSSICKQLRFTKQDYASRTGFNFGDSWMMSWGADGKTYTNFSDGKFFEKDWQTNALLTIDDDPPRIEARSFTKLSANPLMRETSWAYYITSTIVVENTIYVAIVDIAPQGLGAHASGIARSDDGGKTLVHDRTKPMWPKNAVKPFVYPSFLQNGRGYSGNADGFMYMYGTDGDWGGVRGGINTIRLARVSLRADFLDVTKYEYFDGRGGWSSELREAGDLIADGKNLGGMQSVVYNPVLRRYFLITFAEPESPAARMVLYDAPEPWGPWYRCGVIPGEQTVFTTERLFHTAYNPSFNAKWITPEGAMWISYSNYTPQYTFHYGLIVVER